MLSMNFKKILKIVFLILAIQLVFNFKIVKATTYNTENNYLYYDTEEIKEYSEEYKKYLELPDEEKEKIRCNTKKI